MSNEQNTNERSGDDMLTQEDQERFDALFSETNRLTLTHDWDDRLLRELAAESSTEVATMLVDQPVDNEAPVIDLTKERETRRKSVAAPLALVACLLLAVAGIGLLSLPDGQPDDIAVIPASQQVDPPTVSDLDVPDGATELVEATDGTIVAVVEQPDSGQVVLATTTDLVNWENSAPVPLIRAIVDVSTDIWYVVGSDPNALQDNGSIDGAAADTEIAAFSSSDRGSTWAPIETLPSGEVIYIDEADGANPLPSTSFEIASISIGVAGDQVMIAHGKAAVTNWTELARDAGLVDDDTNVVAGISGGQTPVFFAFGPNTFEEIEITANDLGVSRQVFDGLRFGVIETTLQRSVAGGAFEEIPLPSSQLVLADVGVRDGDFVVSGLASLATRLDEQVYRSTDGTNWVESDEPPVFGVFLGNGEEIAPPLNDVLQFLSDTPTNDGGVISELGDWQVRINDESEQLRAEQSSLGSSSFSSVPTPDVEAQLVGGFGTDFGAALVWQDMEASSLEVSRSIVEDNGYSFEFFDNGSAGSVTVTDPQGEVLVEQMGLFAFQLGRVINDAGNVVVFDEQGAVAASVSIFDVRSSFLRTGERVENPPARFISWASGPDNWSFAELEGLESAVWRFTILDDGILATAVDDPTEALFISWPAEFGE